MARRSASLVWLNPKSQTYYENFTIELASGERERHRGTLGTSDRREAERAAEERKQAREAEQARLKHLRAAGVNLAKDAINELTLLEALAKYMTEYGDAKPSAVGLRGYNKAFIAYFGGAKLLGDLGTADLSGFTHWLASGEMARRDENYSATPSPRTVNAYLVHLRAVMNRARFKWQCRVADIQWGMRYGTPGLLADEPEPPRRVVEEDGEESDLRAALDPDTQPVYDFSLLTTVRQSNAIFLRKAQVKWGRGVIEFRVKHKKKGGKHHEVPITDEVATILRSEWGNHPEFVFTYRCRLDHHQSYTTARGKRVMVNFTAGERYPFTKSVLRDRWDEAREKLGITDLTWHGLRRTGITRTIRETGDPKIAQQLAGHADLATTMRYNVVTTTDVRAAMEALAARRRAQVHRNDRKVAS